MLYMGIDPGLAKVGWAVIDNLTENMRCGMITTSSYDKFAFRMGFLINSLGYVINTYEPDAIAVESVSYGKQIASATDIVQIVGALTYKASLKDIEVISLSPSHIKKTFTGSGKSSKADMKKRAKLLWPGREYTADEVDALATAWTYLKDEENSFRRK